MVKNHDHGSPAVMPQVEEVKPATEIKPKAQVKPKGQEEARQAVSAAIALVTTRLERQGERPRPHRGRRIRFRALLLAALIGAALLAVMRLS